MRVPLILLFGCIISVAAAAQNNFHFIHWQPGNTDSLKKLLTSASDTARVNVLNELSFAYALIQRDSSRIYALQAYKEASALRYSNGMVISLLYLSEGAMMLGDQTKAKAYAVQAYEAGKKGGDPISFAHAGLMLGLVLQGDEGLAIVELADSIFKVLDDTIGQLDVLASKACLYKWVGRTYDALQAYHQYGRLGKLSGDHESYATALHQIGRIYAVVGDYTTANVYTWQGVAYRQLHHMPEYLVAYEEICENYMQLKKYDSALYTINRSIAGIKSTAVFSPLTKNLLTTALVRKGEVCVKLGLYDSAMAILLPVHHKVRKEQDNATLMRVLLPLGEAYTGKKDFNNSLRCGQKLMRLASSTGDKTSLKNAAGLLATVFHEQKRNDSAYYYLQLFTALKDSLAISHFQNNLTFFKTMREKEAAESKITLLDKDKQIKQQQLNLLIIGLIALFSLGVLVVYFINGKRKSEGHRRAMLEQELQIEKLESEKKQASWQQQATEMEMQALHTQMDQVLKLQQMRTRIASDLHDDVGSTLTSIAYYSELAKMKLKEEDTTLRPFLEKIGNSARYTISAMSDIVWIINPNNDTSAHLISRMKHYATEMLGERDIPYCFNTNEEMENVKLTMQQRKNLFLIYKEAVHNAVKYAQCSRIGIDFSRVDSEVLLRIRDNGKGFDVNSINNDGNGLVNMKNRAAEMNADIKVSSLKGVGTEVQVILQNHQNW